MMAVRCYNGLCCGSVPCERLDDDSEEVVIKGRVEICWGLTLRLMRDSAGKSIPINTRVEFVDEQKVVAIGLDNNMQLRIILPDGQLALVNNKDVRLSGGSSRPITITRSSR